MKKAPKSPIFPGPLPVKALKLITPVDTPARALEIWNSGKIIRTQTYAYLCKHDIYELERQGYDAVSLCNPNGHVLVTIPFKQGD